MECVVLAGGKGTRLRSVVSDLPKCMAPVAGRPFLAWLLDDLREASFDHIILSLGYKHEAVEAWVATRPDRDSITCVVEEEPLGTGGGVRLALRQAREDAVFILNGDTFFGVDYPAMQAFHRQSGAQATLALKPLRDFDRYGEVTLDGEGRIAAFREKRPCAEGLINGGVYLLQRDALAEMPERFSLEKDYFEPKAESAGLAGFRSEGYFIDIGIPADYARAQRDFADGAYRSYPYDALLLDRDGVINVLRPNDYVKNIAEFVFCDGALEALRRLNPCFRRIVIVTNQRGVGRGLMTEADLAEIHDWMLARIREAGGRIDRIYVCTAVDPADPRRKPNPGMAREVRADFPDVDFARSILVGDSASDLEFARRAGIPAVCLRDPDNLLTFARSLNPTDPS
jgi:D-glycero-alpha-D-manno-heptose 1-phosphate guanylyltransferase